MCCIALELRKQEIHTMAGAASNGHTLCTTEGHPALTHALRLLPGDDVLSALLEYVNARKIVAAAVVGCVVSIPLRRIRIRQAINVSRLCSLLPRHLHDHREARGD